MKTSNTKNSSENPFFQPFEGFDGYIPFDKIHLKHYKLGLEKAIDLGKSRIQAIKESSEPTFENTIEALEVSTEEIHLICSVFFQPFKLRCH